MADQGAAGAPDDSVHVDHGMRLLWHVLVHYVTEDLRVGLPESLARKHVQRE